MRNLTGVQKEGDRGERKERRIGNGGARERESGE